MAADYSGIREALKEVNELQLKYAKFGAFDTECCMQAQVIIKRVVKGENVDWDYIKSHDWWDLYTASMNCKRVNTALTNGMKRIANKIKKIIDKASYADAESLVETLREDLWRVDWDSPPHNTYPTAL